MKTISLNDLFNLLRSPTPPVLVEALPARYFAQGHLPGACNINTGEVKTLAPQLLPDKDAGIVVYCASVTCTNSDQVAVQLHALGYSDVTVFKGGKAEWQAAGHALEGVAA
ncbi:rhodanese-like domain-containing protein [Candidatus Macondimonas diazotrophica]|jgi:rhodanese-related sulfurtransferase|uniref:Rhodanese-like domain-containing protein n=1 Tax=Candidatus Macondimonas diazotrophica TaxID=2305248 RepID=A0A4Z0FCR1_9GAMM|nr:rhodanese-like domain-containing protein [Candidatus Macondimonas diazotrophica]NCU00475.1 rhodanese-like domain-containing protein [Candidatus Macondimonas diazotrophica]TFZ84064.1 rhodanese-like domain-containing protein [Candidatus Macondimonas diazotrophica]HBG31692.1 sulfurtransferase [Gammaproteobacteria bacterium]